MLSNVMRFHSVYPESTTTGISAPRFPDSGECTDLFKPDVIHMNHNAANLIAVAWLLRRFPVLRSVHDVAFLCPIRYYIRANTHAQCDASCGRICFSSGCLSVTRPHAWHELARTKIAQWMHAKWGRLNTQSRYMQGNLRHIAGRPMDVSVLPVFIPPIANCEPLPESSAHFLYVGRLNRRKGPQLAIEAMAQLPDRATLGIVGSGDMERELRRLVQKYNLDSRVRFTGFLESDDLQQQYSKGCAVLLPGMIPENCPMSVQEAMAACRAVIATNVGGIPDLVEDGVSGYLVPPGNVPALAAAMQKFLDNPQLCRTFGLNGRRRIAEEQYQRKYHIRKLTGRVRADHRGV